MHNHRITDTEKVSLALASMIDDVVITNFCTKHGIARSSLYSWRKALLTELSASISQKNPLRRTS